MKFPRQYPLVLFFFLYYFSFSHSQVIDSLKNVLKSAKEDTNKVNTLSNLAWQLHNIDKYDESLKYIKDGIALGEKLKHHSELAILYRRYGDYFNYTGDYVEALQEYTKALDLETLSSRKDKMAVCYERIAKLYVTTKQYPKAVSNFLDAVKLCEYLGDTMRTVDIFISLWNVHYKKMDDAKNAAGYLNRAHELVNNSSGDSLRGIVYNKIGKFYFKEGDYEKSAEFLNKAMHLHLEKNDKKRLSTDYYDIGNLYENTGNYQKAQEYYRKILAIREEIGTKHDQALANNNAGWGYQLTGDYLRALELQLKSYRLYVETGDDVNIAYPLGNLGIIYNQLGAFEKAIEYSTKAMALFERNKDFGGVAEAYNNIGNAYSNLDKYDKAIENLQKGLDVAKSESNDYETKNSYEGFADVYQKMGDYKKAFQSYKLFSQVRDSIMNQENIERVSRMHFSLENEKNQKAIELLNKDAQLKEAELKKQRTIIYAAIVGVILTLLLVFFAFRGYLRNRKTNEQLSRFNSEISSQKKEIENTYQNVKLLSEIGKQITSCLTVEKIIETTYENINQLMDASSFWIGIYNETTQRLEYPLGKEKGKTVGSAYYNLSENNHLPVWAFKNQKEAFVNDYLKDYAKYIPNGMPPKPVAGEMPESSIWIPLISKDRHTLGIITIQSFKKNSYTEYHLNIVRNLALFTSIAVENALMYEQVERKVKERTAQVVKQKEEIELTYKNIKLLSEIGQQITSCLSVEKIIETAYENINRLMDASVFWIGIYNQPGNRLDFPGAFEKRKRLPFFFIPLDDHNKLSSWCFNNKQSIFLNDVQNGFRNYLPHLTSYGAVMGEMVSSIIYLPLISKNNKEVGVITVQSFKKNAYTEYHQNILKSLAVFVNIALENALMYEGVEQKVKDRTMEVVKQKEELEEKNKDITDSIKYASRIQHALLASDDYISKQLMDYFVFLKPRDIVSGDFYWMAEKGDKLFFSVVDCTGHGVPGAFVSIIGNNGLYRAVNEFGLEKPSEILDKLNELVEETFRQSSNGEIKDGMDIALCCYDRKNKTLEFAGANNPLYHISNGALTEIKGDKQPVGAFENRKKFTNQIISIKENDSIYIFSDGYADQFGGSHAKKFKYNQFKAMLLSMQDKPMTEQKEVLDKTILSWMGDLEQVDDICVIGVRV
ncbi:MAG: tetratricopeptide repeat protein [Bacteroidetes bacterium]|nr:tetratricopeptide repeat protein [Bacteroidota bacterium]